ncbi:MAG: tetratricopeptide repeat protein [Phycisphaerae bacterium]|nr:tetratricopeptide repeat protein [Phycisphaerae bacterium]
MNQDGIEDSIRGDGDAEGCLATKRRWPAWIAPLAVVTVTLLAFLPSLTNGFVNWDDLVNFIENRNYRGLGWSNLEWMFTTFHAGPYQPLSWVTLGADYVLWGMDARGYHLTSLLLHAGTVLAFYYLALRLLGLIAGDRGARDLRFAAAAAALVFGIHPLRAESVAWATERRDVVSGLFFMLTLLAYLRAWDVRDDPQDRRKWLGLSLLAYLASLLGKGMGITLPVVLLILDVYPLRRLGGDQAGWLGAGARRVWAEKLPYFALAAVAGLIGVYGQVVTGAVAGLEQYGTQRRVGVTLYAVAFYVYKTALPLNLSPLYPMPRTLSLTQWPYVLNAIALSAITAAAVLARHRWPAGLAVWLSYLVMVAPVSGVTQMGPQIAADRYTYLPCLGFALLAGWAAVWLIQRGFEGLVVKTIASGAILVLGVLTFQQTMIWHDSVSLWAHAGGIYPDSRIVQQNWGAALAAEGDQEEALKHHIESARLAPESAEAENNIGQTLIQLGRIEEAKTHLRRAIKLRPGHAAAHYNLGNALIKQGRLRDAAKSYRAALEHRPGMLQAKINLANTLDQLRQTPEAERLWQEVIDENPMIASAYGNWATSLIRRRRYAEAAEVLRRGLAACPTDARLRDALREVDVLAPKK